MHVLLSHSTELLWDYVQVQPNDSNKSTLGQWVWPKLVSCHDNRYGTQNTEEIAMCKGGCDSKIRDNCHV